uniref:Agenet domain-containing protein n=1 Tax=Macrostomum lignano TaxID=282301 RepID=A0A1I8J635_9PLAT
GQWLAAAPVGSPVSVVGASSLPLELQLEDPCRPSWEAFGSSDRWRQVKPGEAVLTTFIWLLSESCHVMMRINMSLSSHLLFHRLGLFVSEEVQQSSSPINFFVDSCSFGKAACWLSDSSGRDVNDPVKKIDNKNRTLVRVRSEFGFNVSITDRNADIVCKGTAESERKETAWNGIISEISEPCETAVDLGPEKFWLAGQTKLVQVISKRCSIWNVSHSCWLKLNADAAVNTPLQKVQGEFNSTHELRVIETMARQNWQVLCSVNQSGVEHIDSESSLSSAPAVFSEASKSTIELSLAYDNNSQSEVHVHEVDQNENQNTLLPVYSINCSVAGDEASTELSKISSTEWHGLLKLRWNRSSV